MRGSAAIKNANVDQGRQRDRGRDSAALVSAAPVLGRIHLGTPPGTRTQNLRIKSPLLCQIELEALGGAPKIALANQLHRGVTEGSRTPDLRDHNPAL